MTVRTAHRALALIIALWGLALVMLVSSACTPLAKPATVAQSLAYVEGQVQAAVRTCARLNDERRITIEQATRCQAVTSQAFAAVDVGMGAVKSGNSTRAESQLAAVRILLLEAERIAGGAK